MASTVLVCLVVYLLCTAFSFPLQDLESNSVLQLEGTSKRVSVTVRRVQTVTDRFKRSVTGRKSPCPTGQIYYGNKCVQSNGIDEPEYDR